MRVFTLIAVCLFALLAMARAEICACPRIFSPVCGSDGFNYDNECEMLCQAKKTGRDIKVVKKEAC